MNGIEIICERIIEVALPNDELRELVIKIGKPFPDPKPGGDWACTFEVTGLEEKIINTAFGVDALQALLLCIKMIEANLKYLERKINVRFTWLESDDLGLSMA